MPVIERCRHVLRAARNRRSSRSIQASVLADPTLVSSSALSLSTSALHAALMEHLEKKGLITTEEQGPIFERALELLETDPADDGGITALARYLVEQQLPRNADRERFRA